MNSRLRNRKLKIISILFTAFLLSAPFVLNQNTNGALSEALRNVAVPIWQIKTQNKISAISPNDFFKNKENLLQEIDKLESQIEDLKYLKYENSFLKAQNDTFLSMLSVNVFPDDKQRRVGRIISFGGSSPYGTLQLEVNNAMPGDVVITRQSIAIGRVLSAGDKVSTVGLFSSAGNKLSVTVGYGESSTPAEAIGMGNGNFLITTSKDIEVKEGDLVFSAEAKGYPIAVVGSIEKNPVDAFAKIRARLPFNIKSIYTVLVE